MTAPMPARRVGRRGWRDPRIVVGVSLMVVSVVIGALLLSSYDRTVGVWALRRDLPAGVRVTADDLTDVQVRFADGDLEQRYFSTNSQMPATARLSRPVEAGDLLPRSALTDGRERPRIEVPLSVPADEVPATVRPGSVVDVWVAPDAAGAGAGRPAAAGSPSARQVLDDVTVVRVSGSPNGFSAATTRQVVVAVSGRDAEDLGTALGLAGAGDLVLTRQG